MILVTVAIVATALGYLAGVLFIGRTHLVGDSARPLAIILRCASLHNFEPANRSPFQHDDTTYSCLGAVSQWLIEERDWCCSKKGIGCWSTTSAPDFDCTRLSWTGSWYSVRSTSAYGSPLPPSYLNKDCDW